MTFPNYAGKEIVDELLKKELKDAGIEIFESPYKSDGEVKTNVIGTIGPWIFKRAWYYWVATGDGIPPLYAWELYKTNGKDARIEGHCCCPDPSYCKGFAVGLYHVDNPEGLKALADIIKKIKYDFELGVYNGK